PCPPRCWEQGAAASRWSPTTAGAAVREARARPDRPASRDRPAWAGTGVRGPRDTPAPAASPARPASPAQARARPDRPASLARAPGEARGWAVVAARGLETRPVP